MTNRVITIKKAGNMNNVMYKDVLVGCFEDGDTETLAMIIDRAIDVYIERRNPEILEVGLKLLTVGYDMGKKGQPKGLLTKLVNTLI